MAIAAERSGRETLATAFILGGDVHLNEPPGELGIGQCMAWPEIRLRTYEVAVVDGEIEVAL